MRSNAPHAAIYMFPLRRHCSGFVKSSPHFSASNKALTGGNEAWSASSVISRRLSFSLPTTIAGVFLRRPRPVVIIPCSSNHVALANDREERGRPHHPSTVLSIKPPPSTIILDRLAHLVIRYSQGPRHDGTNRQQKDRDITDVSTR